ncbi:hypothetical protein GQ457_04G019870 [Hibiscus cannabinus]
MTSALTLVADVSVDFADVLVTPPIVHLPSLVPLDLFNPVNPSLHDPRLMLIVTRISSSFQTVQIFRGVMFSGSCLLYCLLFQNYCMPTDFHDLLFTVYMLSLWVPTLRPRINPYGPEVTPRVAPTPTGPRIFWIGRRRIDIGGSTLSYSSTFLYVSIFRFVLLLLVTCAYVLYIVWPVYCSTLLSS